MDKGQKQFLEFLIVEDDAVVSRLHRFCLENMVANEVRTFQNGKEAIAHLQKTASENKKVLILLDLNMPVMSGWEFLESCQNKFHCREISIVILTSSSYKEDCERGRKYEQVIGYYTKPLNRCKMLEILELEPEIAALVAPALVRRYDGNSQGESMVIPR